MIKSDDWLALEEYVKGVTRLYASAVKELERLNLDVLDQSAIIFCHSEYCMLEIVCQSLDKDSLTKGAIPNLVNDASTSVRVSSRHGNDFFGRSYLYALSCCRPRHQNLL